MKNPERVAELLAELRELAENDFECHRIDVLERDLTEPPTVEIIDDTHQKFGGFTFSTDAKNHFRLNVNLHRLVWTYYHGEIPVAHDIHHIDENKSNNAISNLLCLTHEEHRKIHMTKKVKTIRRKFATFICAFCGKEFTTLKTGSNKFCSVTCRNKAERATRREIRQCVVCGKSFDAYKHDKTITCSAKCAAQLAAIAIKSKEPITKVCVKCGKDFQTRSVKAQYCSKQCRSKAQRERLK